MLANQNTQESQELLKISLPKWPALFVKGEHITIEQAAQVIIRTDSIFQYMSCNYKEWIKELCDVVGVRYEWGGGNDEDLEKVRKKIKHLNLEYLSNHQIASNYIDGAHGWCKWDGKIFTNHYNIGKWPSMEDIANEWCSIAKAFPFLSLTSQLYSGEQCEENIEPIVRFKIANGLANILPPDNKLGIVVSIDTDFDLTFQNERGCTIEMFRDAFKSVVDRMSDE